jgi:hypothetical protein
LTVRTLSSRTPRRLSSPRPAGRARSHRCHP